MKDARGHGSNARGGSVGQIVTSLLGGGHPKSAPVPIHTSMVNRITRDRGTDTTIGGGIRHGVRNAVAATKRLFRNTGG